MGCTGQNEGKGRDGNAVRVAQIMRFCDIWRGIPTGKCIAVHFDILLLYKLNYCKGGNRTAWDRNEIVTWNAMAEGELSNFTPKRTRFC